MEDPRAEIFRLAKDHVLHIDDDPDTPEHIRWGMMAMYLMDVAKNAAGIAIDVEPNDERDNG